MAREMPTIELPVNWQEKKYIVVIISLCNFKNLLGMNNPSSNLACHFFGPIGVKYYNEAEVEQLIKL